ncbi:MAG: tRNA (adenosine(37)-N6)-threonylcarbamoyltransferase complex ATPase subunit type 1 TsaE [Bdellovibrionia bacterium]
MHLKKSKPTPQSLWKAASGCDEEAIAQIARDLAQETQAGDRFFLEGTLGSGKSTFAQALIAALGVSEPPAGSPTFALAHEYTSKVCDIIHLDFYRLKSQDEIEEAGIDSYFWERKAIVISEWISLWPEYESQVARTSPCVWRVRLELETTPTTRSIEITRSEMTHLKGY